MTTYGLEIEMGDINLLKAAQVVFKLQEISFEEWRDRGVSLSEKVRRYDRWNISSDKTISNHNGTRCRRLVMLPDGSIVGGKESNRQYWQGAELISPILRPENMEEDFYTLNKMLLNLDLYGAEIDPDLFHDLHVHVDFGAQSETNWKRLLEFTEWVREAQYLLIAVHEAATSQHSPKTYRYSDDFINDLLKTKDYEEYSYEYRRHHKLPDGSRQSFELYQYRRLICPGAVMDPTKNYNTLEWRVWPGTRDPKLIQRIAEFSIKSTEKLPTLEYVRDWSQETIEMIKNG